MTRSLRFVYGITNGKSRTALSPLKFDDDMETPNIPLSEQDEKALNEQQEQCPVSSESGKETDISEKEYLETPEEESEEENAENKRIIDLSASELVDKLALLLQQEILPKRQQIESFKSAFYKIKSRAEESKEENPSLLDEVEVNEQRLKDFLNVFKEKHQAFVEEQNRQKELNLEKKRKLIARLTELLTSTEEFGKISPVFHEIRTEWKDCGPVSEQFANELQREYNALVEQFYDLKQINDEFREYDFKKNLEQKRELINEAEKLAGDTDFLRAFRALQELHRQWREIGPVARDLREEIWAEFKKYSTIINKNHQEHFERRKEQEEANLEAKTKLCEEVELLLTEPANTIPQWEALTKKLLKMQNEWKQIGYAPKKENEQIYRRFRAGCDHFFELKSEFYTQMRNQAMANLELKRALLKQAEELKDSEDWKETTKKMIELQRQWKQIGAVPRKYSNDIWKQFQTACDHFFERKKESVGDPRAEERNNLKRKKDIIAQVLELLNEDDYEQVKKKLNELNIEWKTIGFVPFKAKEKVYNDYRKAMDSVYDKFKVDRNQRRLEGYSASIEKLESGKGLSAEKARMTRILESMQQELITYRNNLSFFNVSSKKGSSLVEEMERKKQKLEEDIALMEEKIALIDDKMEAQE